MKKRGKGTRKAKNPNADLDKFDGYDVSESDDGIDADERVMIDTARGRPRDIEEEEVFKVYRSSDDDDDDEDENMEDEEAGDDDEQGAIGSDMDSDIEKQVDADDDLPDSKAWGSKKRDYYSTDYVDQDYLGFDNEEAALMEEREANEIQQRLLAELEGADFSLGLLESVEEKKQELVRKATMEPEEEKESVAKDLSKLTKEQLLDIVKRESPGFLELMDITKEYCEKMKKYIIPMLALCEKLEVPNCQATELLKTYKRCCSIFMMNVSFFINVKISQTIDSDRHPVVKIIGQYLTLLRMMDNIMKEKGVLKAMKKIVKKDKKGVKLVVTEVSMKDEGIEEEPTGNRAQRRKKKLMILQKKENLQKEIQEKTKKLRWNDEVEVNTLNNEIEKQLGEKLLKNEKTQEEDEQDDEEMDEEDEDEEGDSHDKRPITYQMMKNKGLTPRRKKEVRNPRVRNKNKFKKAVKNRRGQVRQVRKEIKKYDGEYSGINKFVSKSIKIK